MNENMEMNFENITLKTCELFVETLQKTALVFTIIGAINWGLVGIFDLNLVDFIFQDMDIIKRIIYIIIAICGLINIGLLFNHIEDK